MQIFEWRYQAGKTSLKCGISNLVAPLWLILMRKITLTKLQPSSWCTTPYIFWDFLARLPFVGLAPKHFCRCCCCCCFYAFWVDVGPTFGRWLLPRISSELGGAWGRRLLPMQWFPFITFWVQLVNFWEGCFRSWTLFKWDLLFCSFVLIFHFVIIST